MVETWFTFKPQDLDRLFDEELEKVIARTTDPDDGALPWRPSSVLTKVAATERSPLASPPRSCENRGRHR
jgi:hypothetical protein